jgi:transcriptional regulator with XRE-family HTH domain
MENMRDLVCNNFNRLVDASPLTKRELAKMIGVNENTLQRWKNKDSYPELPNIEKLATALNVSPLEFYKTESKPSHKVSDIREAMFKIMASVPDDIFELAAKLDDPKNDVWEAIAGLLEDEINYGEKEKSNHA